jgi:ADP-heptose:LPS heptosyltransferase
MKILMIKLGAAGDVVRTTPLLQRLSGEITWITAAANRSLLDGIAANVTVLSWEERDAARNTVYDLVISLAPGCGSGWPGTSRG